MDLGTGVALLVAFLAVVVLIIRGQSPIIMLLLLAVLWAAIAGIGIDDIQKKVLQGGGDGTLGHVGAQFILDQRGRGLVAVSGGNHAQAVAYVGRRLGLPAVILMPQSTPRNYIEATQGYGAEVVLVPNATEAFCSIVGRN